LGALKGSCAEKFRSSQVDLPVGAVTTDLGKAVPDLLDA